MSGKFLALVQRFNPSRFGSSADPASVAFSVAAFTGRSQPGVDDHNFAHPSLIHSRGYWRQMAAQIYVVLAQRTRCGRSDAKGLQQQIAKHFADETF